MSNFCSKDTALITGASTGIGAVYADRCAPLPDRSARSRLSEHEGGV